ncbi:unnamed protein product [Rotaria sp. Silwood1]|nr:unnamed protein product [Rotaria sp. Silwood1]CAF4732057.1 unnamed protein product [Rotaria sp. Silwood1]
MLKLDDLRERVKKGEINQVVISFPDMDVRLMGKRVDADFFVESAADNGTYCCTSLLACDMNMEPQSGYTYANWQRGFGDFHSVPDSTSLRLMSWHNKTATVMCDIYDDKENEHILVPYAPRSILRKQIEAASKLSYKVLSASDYPEDYHLLQAARGENTAAFRIVGKGQSTRIECRLPGGDCNIYLAFAVSLAAGLRGIADQLEPPLIFEGDIYQAKEVPQASRTLKEAIHVFENSNFVREAFGEDVVNHYLNFYRLEQAAFEKSVTDWERHRYLEQI